MIEDFPDYFADCKARGREIIGSDYMNGKWTMMPFGLVNPMEQLRLARIWWKERREPPLLTDLQGKQSDA